MRRRTIPLGLGVAAMLAGCGSNGHDAATGAGSSGGGTTTTSSGPAPDGGTHPSPSTVTIADTSGHGQMSRPVSIPRPFAAGAIAHCPQAVVGGTPLLTQADVKNRWPDGSVKFAIVSFVAPQLGATPVTVSFQDQMDCNNGGPLTTEDMLASDFDFDVKMTLTGAATRTISARSMLSAGLCRPWLQGPIVTACIIEDRTPARSFDTNTDGAAPPGGAAGNPLHPIFEAWFYPSTHHVDVGATVENIWISSTKANSLKDQDYALSIQQGMATPTSCYAEPSFTHIGFSRWRRPCTTGPAHGSIHVDFNAPNVVGTGLLPNYDTRHAMTEPMLQTVLAGWEKVSKNVEGGLTDSGCGAKGCVGLYEMPINGAGQHTYVGLNTKWDVLYLLSMDDRLGDVMLGNADLAGRMPIFAREADSNAGTGQFFDAPCAGCGTPPTSVVGSVGTFGRPFSINARQQASLVQGYGAGSCNGNTADIYNVGTVTTGGISGINIDTSQAPDMFYLPYLFTGSYYYLEGLEMQAAFALSQRNPCYISSPDTYNVEVRQGRWALASSSTSIRAQAWAFRTMAYAAAISPDSDPEHAYFASKLTDQIAEFEGGHGVNGPTGSYGADPDKAAIWAFGHTRDSAGGVLWTGTTVADNRGPSPIGTWRTFGNGYVQPPLVTTGSVAAATNPGEQSFMTAALGVARDLGFATSGLLQFEAERYFRLALDASYDAPYLLDADREPTVMTASPDAWIADGATYTSAFTSLPNCFSTVVGNTCSSAGTSMQDSHAYESKSAISFMTTYSAAGIAGADVWSALDMGPKAIPNAQWLYDATDGNGSPVWSLRPRTTGP